MQARYNYRFYPTEQQAVALAKAMGGARWVWNDALAFCQQAGKYVGLNELCRQLTKIKQGVAWLKEVSNVVLQQSLRCLDKAYKHFFQGRRKEISRPSPSLRADLVLEATRFIWQKWGMYPVP